MLDVVILCGSDLGAAVAPAAAGEKGRGSGGAAAGQDGSGGGTARGGEGLAAYCELRLGRSVYRTPLVYGTRSPVSGVAHACGRRRYAALGRVRGGKGRDPNRALATDAAHPHIHCPCD